MLPSGDASADSLRLRSAERNDAARRSSAAGDLPGMSLILRRLRIAYGCVSSSVMSASSAGDCGQRSRAEVDLPGAKPLSRRQKVLVNERRALAGRTFSGRVHRGRLVRPRRDWQHDGPVAVEPRRRSGNLWLTNRGRHRWARAENRDGEPPRERDHRGSGPSRRRRPFGLSGHSRRGSRPASERVLPGTVAAPAR